MKKVQLASIDEFDIAGEGESEVRERLKAMYGDKDVIFQVAGKEFDYEEMVRYILATASYLAEFYVYVCPVCFEPSDYVSVVYPAEVKGVVPPMREALFKHDSRYGPIYIFNHTYPKAARCLYDDVINLEDLLLKININDKTRDIDAKVYTIIRKVKGPNYRIPAFSVGSYVYLQQLRKERERR